MTLMPQPDTGKADVITTSLTKPETLETDVSDTPDTLLPDDVLPAYDTYGGLVLGMRHYLYKRTRFSIFD